jgi:hypothetical protein
MASQNVFKKQVLFLLVELLVAQIIEEMLNSSWE